MCTPGPTGPTTFFSRAGRWWAVTKAWRKRDTLTPDELADVRVAVGWAVPAADVQGTEELHGPWLVLAPTAATTDG